MAPALIFLASIGLYLTRHPIAATLCLVVAAIAVL